MPRSIILFLAANPAGTSSLALDQECAAIERELRLTPGRDDFEFRSKWAVTVDELMRHLLDLQPTILHFSGHGSAQGMLPGQRHEGRRATRDVSCDDHTPGLLLQGDDGQPQLVTPAALTKMIQTTANTVRLVVLNACYADAQAEALRDVVGCAIGMKGTISDDAARAFAVGFYRALGHRRPVGNAYAQARATLEGKRLDAQAEPRCLARAGGDVDTLVLGGDAPQGAPAPVPRPDDPVAAWLQFGLQRHGRVMVVGFRDASIPIDLDRVFVPLYVYADRARRGGGPDARDDKEGIGLGGAEISFDDALDRASDGRTCLALIGDPGAGKTTLLRHLFRRVVSGEVTGAVAHLRGLHPVLVRLATVTDSELVARGLERIALRVATEDGYPQAGSAILARPNQGFLFLLDGLDEVRDEPTRERVCAWLNDEIDHWPGCVFVVTSRRAAWARTPALGARFLPVSVQGLRDDATAEYVRRWFRAVVRHFFGAVDSPADVEARANERTEALLEVLATPAWRSSTHLLEMTANPLMLSTLCLAYYNDTRLPDRRGELYERTLGLLIEVWTRERLGGPALRLETARLVLQPLAYAMHEQDRRELAVDEAAALVKTPLTQVPALRAVAPTPERFLDLVRDECGVLMSRDLGRIEFVHLSFQEYLAACHVAGRGLGRTLADHAGDPRWEEVILLAMSRPGVFEPFMTRALERGDVDPALLRQCLRETLEILPVPFEVAADRALARLRTPDNPLTRFGRWLARHPTPSPATDELRRLFELVQGYDLPSLVERAQSVISSNNRALRTAARRLVELEDAEVTTPRQGHPFVEPATGMTFVWIPGGKFMMGSSKKPGQPNYHPSANYKEIPVRPVRLTGFWMSVYPVTNKQYARFVTETARVAPTSFADRRFNDPAQPVVMVTWDDARAFTAWLTTKFAVVVARLPTEAEWEYTARGTDGRHYPWGNDSPDASLATFGQPSDTEQPAVVGHTPAGKSPFNVHDLAGNVWEWCLDVWADGYAEIQAGPVDPCHRDHTGGEWRVVRGGSWHSDPKFLRSAFRGRGHPVVQFPDLGFRVVCGGAGQPDAH
jgi:formylglycine-generating enzyme required for sulfatase activity